MAAFAACPSAAFGELAASEIRCVARVRESQSRVPEIWEPPRSGRCDRSHLLEGSDENFTSALFSHFYRRAIYQSRVRSVRLLPSSAHKTQLFASYCSTNQ